MVILETKPGRLANRTFYFAYFIANAIEYGYRLYNPPFAEYADLFPAMANQKRIAGYPIYVQLPQDALFRYFYPRLHFHLPRLDTRNRWHWRLQVTDEYDLNQADFTRAARTKICWPNGWMFRDHANLVKYRETIRDVFTPIPAVMTHAQQAVEQCRKSSSDAVVVGVHIRRTDYAEFLGGRYLFSLEQYAGFMRDFVRHWSHERRIDFLICSDEVIDLQIFEGLAVRQSRGSAIEDLYTLAHCDYLLGPPSTFSMWASYWGQVPLCMLTDTQKEIRPEEFQKILSMDHFADGSSFRHG